MKVFHLVYNLIRGGTEGQCARIAMALAAAGDTHRVGVSVRDGYFVDAVERLCGPIHEMNIRRLIGLDTHREIGRLSALLRDGGFDLLHAWDADAAIFGSVAARRAHIPHITSRRDLGEIYAPRKRILMRLADQRAAAIVCNAAAIRDRLFPRPPLRDRVTVIPNVLDLAEFDALAARPFPREADLPPGRRIVSVARLDPEKDVATLIRAFAIVAARVDDVSLVVAGDGVERSRLEDDAASSGVRARVAFLGDTSDIPALLARCHVAALTPSSNEGLSNSLLEYLAAGLPVVATDCGGNRELVEEGVTGTVVPVGDVAAVARGLFQALESPGPHTSKDWKGRALVRDRHDPAAVAARFSAVYRSVLS